LQADETWDIYKLFGNKFYGGNATVSANLDGLGISFVFYVRGHNPTEAAAEGAIGTNPWYAKAIARTESERQPRNPPNRSYLQFNEVGNLGPGWDDIQYAPNRSSDTIGWGMYQLTNPAPSINQLWSWTANIIAAQARMAGHRTEAQNWITSQEDQQKVDDPNKPLENYTFTYGTVQGGVTFQKGTNKTPVDACAILRYNGIDQGWPIWWDRTAKQWKHRDNSKNYLQKVCDEYKRRG
jgi:hypothetical protein